MKGLVHIYTGNGKGKTTAAIGLGIRAYGRGFKVLMVQFLKGAKTGEIETIKTLAPDFQIMRGKEVKKFIWNMTEEEKVLLKKNMAVTFDIARKASQSEEWDLLILDEIMGAVGAGVISEKEVVDLIKGKQEKQEIVMTGRDAPEALIALADYVSEIKEIKHPYHEGITARKGIEN